MCGLNNIIYFLMILEIDIQDQGAMRVAFWWGLSFWLVDDHPLTVSSHELFSLHGKRKGGEGAERWEEERTGQGLRWDRSKVYYLSYCENSLWKFKFRSQVLKRCSGIDQVVSITCIVGKFTFRWDLGTKYDRRPSFIIKWRWSK